MLPSCPIRDCYLLHLIPLVGSLEASIIVRMLLFSWLCHLGTETSKLLVVENGWILKGRGYSFPQLELRDHTSAMEMFPAPYKSPIELLDCWQMISERLF